MTQHSPKSTSPLHVPKVRVRFLKIVGGTLLVLSVLLMGIAKRDNQTRNRIMHFNAALQTAVQNLGGLNLVKRIAAHFAPHLANLPNWNGPEALPADGNPVQPPAKPRGWLDQMIDHILVAC